MRLALVFFGLLSLVGCTSSTSEPNNKLQLRATTSSIPVAVVTGTSKQQKSDAEPPKKKTDPQPVVKMTDAEIAQRLVGYWEEKRTQPDQGVYERQLELNKTGVISLRGSVQYQNGRQSPFVATGTWKVVEGKLHITVLASDAPQLLPVGTKSADVVVGATATEFSYVDSMSNQLRVLRRVNPKSIPEASKQNLDAEYERLLRGSPWTDRIVQPNAVVVTRHITFDLRGEMTATVRYFGNKQEVRVMLNGSWQVSDGMLHLIVKTSSHPQIIAVGSKSSDKIKHVTAEEFAYIDSVTKLVRVMQRFKD